MVAVMLCLWASSFPLKGETPDVEQPEVKEWPVDTCSITPCDTLQLIKTVESVPEYASRRDNPNWWINRIRSGTHSMADTTVIYPRFVGFCVDVYNWANKAFNYYDSEYVEGTGKRWKARLVNDNWFDSYAMDFKGDVPIWMVSLSLIATSASIFSIWL